jgi:hypothetical protein
MMLKILIASLFRKVIMAINIENRIINVSSRMPRDFMRTVIPLTFIILTYVDNYKF